MPRKIKQPAARVENFFSLIFCLPIGIGKYLNAIEAAFLETNYSIVCFQEGRFKLEEIDKIYFCCRQLQNSQNLRRNGPFSKLRLHAKGKKASSEYFPMH